MTKITTNFMTGCKLILIALFFLFGETMYAQGPCPESIPTDAPTAALTASQVSMQLDVNGPHPGVVNSITVVGEPNPFTYLHVPDDASWYVQNPQASSNRIAKHGVIISDITQPDFKDKLVEANASRDLDFYMMNDFDTKNGDYMQFTFNEPIKAAANRYVVATERWGNNPYIIQALDQAGQLIGNTQNTIPRNQSNTNYIPTGFTESSHNQEVYYAVFPLTAFVAPGTQIYGIRLTQNSGAYGSNASDGGDGKIFILADPFTLAQPPTVVGGQAGITITQPTCENPGFVSFNVQGTTGFDIETSINGDAGPFTAATSYSNLAPGTYTLRLRYENYIYCFTDYTITLDSPTGCPDTDGDTTPDYLDLDDDNDGIPDCAEKGMTGNLQDAFVANSDAVFVENNTEIQLTPEERDKRGQVWSFARADFSTSFTLRMEAYLGTIDGEGADGIAIVFQNDPQGTSASGEPGRGIGAKGIQNGIVLELDTYNNFNDQNPGPLQEDIAEDHGHIWKSQDQSSLSATTPLPNLEDGQWHNVEITWDVATGILSYTVDGTLAGTYTNTNIVADIFGGESKTYFGYTASTGWFKNFHKIRFNNVCDDLPLVLDTDGDGTPDVLDLDSDDDGCPDALEGDENVTAAQLDADNRIDVANQGGVDAQGVPNLVNAGGVADDGGDQGQGVGISTDANQKAAECYDLILGADAGSGQAGTAFTMPSVLANDDLDGATPVIGIGAGEVAVSQSGVWPSGIALDPATGEVNVEGSVEPGTYTVTYEVCVNRSVPDLCKTQTVTIFIDKDSDGDGIFDAEDLDDDNDGILDADENTCANLVQNPSFEAQDFLDGNAFPLGIWTNWGTYFGQNLNTYQLTGWSYTTNCDGWSDLGGQGLAPAADGHQYMDVVGKDSRSTNPPGGSNTLYQELATEAGKTYEFSFYWGEDMGHKYAVGETNLTATVKDQSIDGTVIIAKNFREMAQGEVNGICGPQNWHFYTATFVAQSNKTVIQFTAIASGADGGTGAALDMVSVRAFCDYDGDGIPNHLDTDADGDGCPDALEANSSLRQSDLNAHGAIDAPVGTLTDTYPGVPNNTPAPGIGTSQDANQQALACLDIDNDGVSDADDLDNDNDGILDADEIECVSAGTDLSNYTPLGTSAGYPLDGQTVNTNISGLTIAHSYTGDAPKYYHVYSGYGYDNTAFQGVDGDGSDDNTTATTTFVYTFNQPVINLEVDLRDLDWGTAIRYERVKIEGYYNGALVSNKSVELGSDVVAIADGYYENQTTNVDETNLAGRLFEKYFALVNEVRITLTSNWDAGNVVYFSGGCLATDTDDDGTPDYLDLDSDGDGCSDAIEGDENVTANQLNGNNAIDVANQGGVDDQGVPNLVNAGGAADDGGDQGQGVGVSQYAGSNACDDSDGDGMPDIDDLDDDNDGILDKDECNAPWMAWTVDDPTPAGAAGDAVVTGTLNGMTVTVTNTSNLRDPRTQIASAAFDTYPGTAGLNETGGNIVGQSVLSLANSAAGVTYTFTFANPTTSDLYLHFTAFDLSVNFSPNITIETLVNGTGVGTSSFMFVNDPNVVNDGGLSAKLPAGETSFSFTYPVGGGDNYFLGITDLCSDADGDGIANTLDLDSDNDGCVDAIEGDGNFTTADVVTAGGTVSVGTGSIAENQNLCADGTCVDTDGVPTVANGGQGVGGSQDAATNTCFIQADNDINQTPQGVSVDGNVLTNDEGAIKVASAKYYDNNGDPQDLPLGVSTPVYDKAGNLAGELTLNENGTYTFDPEDGFAGDVPIEYTAENTVGATDDATLTIKVIPTLDAGNNPPIAQNDTYTVEHGNTATVPVLGNDSDPDGDNLTVTKVTAKDQNGAPVDLTATAQDVYVEDPNSPGTYIKAGTAKLVDNKIEFTPEADFTGDVPFDYTISDGNGGEDTAVATVTVLPSNDTNDVYANDDANTGKKGEPITGGILDNDNIEGGLGQLTVNGTVVNANDTEVVIPGKGTLKINPDGTYTFTPEPDFVGTVVIPYEVCNADGKCDTATLYLTTLDKVDAQDDINQTPQGVSVDGNVLTNDTDVTKVASAQYYDNNGDPQDLPLDAATTVYGKDKDGNWVEAGTMTLKEDGTYTFAPVVDFTGDVPIEYVGQNDAGTSDKASLEIKVIPTIEAGNNPPIAQNDTYTVEKGQTAEVYILSNDSDPDQDELSVTKVTAKDSNGNTIDLTDTNQDVYVEDPNNPGTYIYAGTARMQGGQNGVPFKLVFTPSLNFEGDVPFDYTISDGNGGEDTAVAIVTVLPDNGTNDVYANDDANTGKKGEPITGDILGNDNIEGGRGQLTVNGTLVDANDTEIVISGKGTLKINPDGTYTFTPEPDFVGTVAIPYEVCNTDGKCDTATLYLTTLDKVDAQDDINQTPQGVSVDGNVLTNDTDVTKVASAQYYDNNGDPQDLPLDAATTVYGKDENDQWVEAGTMTLKEDGTYTFAPVADFTGDVPIEYVAQNDAGTSDAASLEIKVIPTIEAGNNPPIAQNDTYTVEHGNTATVPVLGNDSDPDGDNLTVTEVKANGSGGTPVVLTDTPQDIYGEDGTTVIGQASVDADGNIVFTPAADFTGDVPFDYTISDGNGGEDTAVATVTVLPSNDTNDVYANDDANVGKKGEPITGGILDNDNIEGGLGQLTVNGTPVNANDTEVVIPGKGTLKINPDGTYTFTPDPDFVGTVAIPYEVCNADGKCDTATLYLTTLDKVDAKDDINQTPQGVSVDGNVLTNDTDVTKVASAQYYDNNGDPQDLPLDAATTVYGKDENDQWVEAGTMTLKEDGTYTFAPVADFTGDVPIDYVGQNDAGTSDDASLEIKVIPDPEAGNNPPIAQNDIRTIEQGQTATLNILDNDADIDGDDLEVTVVTLLDGYTVVGGGTTVTVGTPTQILDADGKVVGGLAVSPGGYTVLAPAPDFTGEVPFEYTIDDGNGGTDTAEATIIVLPSNATNDVYAEDDANTGKRGETLTGNVKKNDFDPENDLFTVTMIDANGDGVLDTAPGTDIRITQNGIEVGRLTINADGSYSWKPASDFVGTVAIPYEITDQPATGNVQAKDVATLYLTNLPFADCGFLRSNRNVTRQLIK